MEQEIIESVDIMGPTPLEMALDCEDLYGPIDPDLFLIESFENLGKVKVITQLHGKNYFTSVIRDKNLVKPYEITGSVEGALINHFKEIGNGKIDPNHNPLSLNLRTKLENGWTTSLVKTSEFGEVYELTTRNNFGNYILGYSYPNLTGFEKSFKIYSGISHQVRNLHKSRRILNLEEEMDF